MCLEIKASENKIIFKINNKSFTSFDIEERKKYIYLINNNQNISHEILIEDYISTIIFYEYYEKTKMKIDLSNQINQIYKNIITSNNNLGIIPSIPKNIIFKNIKYDLIRKSILEELIKNENINILSSGQEINMLYNFKIIYLNLKKSEIKDYDKFDNQLFENIEDLRFYLDSNKIQHFIKESEISNINNINNIIKLKIKDGVDFFQISNSDKITFIEIKQNFETLDSIFVEIISISSPVQIKKDSLQCSKIDSLNNNTIKIEKKEYEYNKLNNKIKKNLINLNDNILFINDDSYLYVILCNIKYDKELLSKLNINKEISNKFKEFEANFINKYSKKFNLIIYDE